MKKQTQVQKNPIAITPKAHEYFQESLKMYMCMWQFLKYTSEDCRLSPVCTVDKSLKQIFADTKSSLDALMLRFRPYFKYQNGYFQIIAEKTYEDETMHEILLILSSLIDISDMQLIEQIQQSIVTTIDNYKETQTKTN